MDKKSLALSFVALAVILASMIYSMGGLGRYSVLSDPFTIPVIYGDLPSVLSQFVGGTYE